MPIGTKSPDRVTMAIEGLEPRAARRLATWAVKYAQAHAPKLSGDSARSIRPMYGRGYFGMRWDQDHPQVWFQNSGVRPFLMRSLAGKTIPMWIDDPTGTERQKNPKAETRTTASGRTQVLIFRRAANPGDTKMADRKRRVNGRMQKVTVPVPKSYPGAPGRIASRQAQAPYNTPSQSIGKIARANVGVRWYFPGLTPRNFLQNGLVEACNKLGILPGAIHVGYGFTPTLDESNKVPAYPQQPLADRMKAMAKGGPRSISSN
jgi:hypothetical protein